MSYYFSKTLEMPFVQAIQHVTEALAGKGFGVLTTIDVRATMKKKLDIDFRPYTILGACNPEFAPQGAANRGHDRNDAALQRGRPGNWQGPNRGLGHRSCSLDDGCR